jgi:hypothetical protein
MKKAKYHSTPNFGMASLLRICRSRTDEEICRAVSIHRQNADSFQAVEAFPTKQYGKSDPG